MIQHRLEDKKFGLWTVKRFSHKVNYGKSVFHYYWDCECSCGALKKVSECHLKSGKSKSCGCKENPINRKLWDPIEIGNGLLAIPLSNSLETAIIDKEDYPIIKDISWYKDSVGYASGLKIRMHRLMIKCPEDQEIDHKDRNKLNNSKVNLRIVSHKQNTINIGLSCKNTTGYTGVSFNKRKNKYETYMHLNGKRIGLGYFTDLNDAIRVSSQARVLREKTYEMDGVKCLK